MRVWLVLGLVGAALIAILGPASSAVGFFSRGLSLDVKVQSPAVLVGKGAAVNQPLYVTCTSRNADLYVQVTQRVGSAIAQGFAYQNVTCAGGIQTVNVTVTASGGKAFKKGTAVVSAQIYGCLTICGSESDTETIAVSQK
jgi:hypothetical protein